MPLILGERKPRVLDGQSKQLKGSPYAGADFSIQVKPLGPSERDEIRRELKRIEDADSRDGLLETFKKCCGQWSGIQNESGADLPYNEDSMAWIYGHHQDLAAAVIVLAGEPNVSILKADEDELKN